MKTISLTQKVFCIVDDDDYLKVCKVKWRAQKTLSGFYACREQYLGCGKSKSVLTRLQNNFLGSMRD